MSAQSAVADVGPDGMSFWPRHGCFWRMAVQAKHIDRIDTVSVFAGDELLWIMPYDHEARLWMCPNARSSYQRLYQKGAAATPFRIVVRCKTGWRSVVQLSYMSRAIRGTRFERRPDEVVTRLCTVDVVYSHGAVTVRRRSGERTKRAIAATDRRATTMSDANAAA